MKVQVICEECGKTIELLPEDDCNQCYVQTKLNDADVNSSVDIKVEVTTDIEDLKEIEDVSYISTENTLNSIRFTCRDCGKYIELTNLD